MGPYRLGDRLGAGGMGDVYRAFDERLERPVALKQIRPERADDPWARRRFRREARAAARLHHPGIVKLHDVLSDAEGDWIVMELVEGQTLARVLAGGPIEPRRALGLAIEVAHALSAAHAEGIVHRDLKAKNVLVTPHDRVKILDFGLAKQVVSRDGRSTSVTADGQILGTPHAMSPEQAMGRKVDLRSDLFSLGSLLYEMFSGAAPFRGSNPMDTLTKVCTHQPADLRERAAELPRGLAELVARLLEKEPTHRPQSAFEVVSALERLVEAPCEAQGITEVAPGVVAGESQETTSPSQPASERRQVTVMCCELVSGDDSSSSLDPEVVYGAMGALGGLVHEVAEGLEAHLGNVLGHRVVVFFGYPLAHEDDTRRAVRAALELVERCRGLSTDSRHPELALRFGIHTGPAVVLRSMAEDHLALGRTLDLATALQQAAQPGEILVSEATWRSIGGVYQAEALDETTLGEGRLVPGAHRIVGPSDASSQWRAMDAATPLVARVRELELLEDRFVLARQGRGQGMLVSGEAGIGKSRLVHAFRGRLTTESPRWLHAQCSSFALNTPLGPIAAMLRVFLGLNEKQSPEHQLDQLEESLAPYEVDRTEAIPLLAQLLGLPLAERFQPLSYSPQKQRQLTLETIVELVLQAADRQATVLVVEDLHWVDPSTLELLTLLLDRLGGRKLFALLTFRMEFEPPWQSEEHLTQLNLARLVGSDVQALIDQVTGGKLLPDEVRQQIRSKTDGVPLFVEELTRNLLESGQLVEHDDRWELAEPLSPLEIPGTLRASLTARLDRQGSAKEVAQLASVIGREFSHRLLAAVSPLGEDRLKQELGRLIDAKLIQRKGFSSRVRYLFRHALIQDAAYDSLLDGSRRALHGEIARALEDRFAEVVAHRPEALAHHFSEARQLESAIDYWLRAGERDVARSAAQEAKVHLGKGLAALARTSLPEEDRDRRELALQSSLAVALSAIESFASASVGKTHDRTLELIHRLGEDPALFPIEWGLWAFYVSKAEYGKASDLAKSLCVVAREGGEPSHLVAALYAAGFTHYVLGDFRTAACEFEEGVQLLEAGLEIELQVGLDFEIAIRSTLAPVLWHVGEPVQALHHDRLALQRANGLNHPAMLALALIYGSHLDLLRGESERARSRAQEALEVSRAHGLFFGSIAKLLLGWAHIMAGWSAPSSAGEATGLSLASVVDEPTVSEGIRILEEGLDEAESWGHDVASSPYTCALAEGYALLGESAKALGLLDSSMKKARRSGEACWQAELMHAKAKLVRRQGPKRGKEARGLLEAARSLARRQGSKYLEQRILETLEEGGEPWC